jgi:chitinase
MAEKGCTGPTCLYQVARNKSPAKEGRSTKTPGYLADAEILQAIDEAESGRTDGAYSFFHDSDSDSDILVYEDVEWVAYMSAETKRRRINRYKSLNFGGVSDWAVDLVGDPAFKKMMEHEAIGILDWTCPGERY